MGPHCVWLIVVGGHVKLNEVNVIDPNLTMLIELGKNVNKHNIHITLHVSIHVVYNTYTVL